MMYVDCKCTCAEIRRCRAIEADETISSEEDAYKVERQLIKESLASNSRSEDHCCEANQSY